MSESEVEAICGIPAHYDKKLQTGLYGNQDPYAGMGEGHVFVFYDQGKVRKFRAVGGTPPVGQNGG